MRLPSIKKFKKAMAGRKGFVIFLSAPEDKSVNDMLVEGPLTDEQYERLESLVTAIFKENGKA